jgi:hypothetical protein
VTVHRCAAAALVRDERVRMVHRSPGRRGPATTGELTRSVAAAAEGAGTVTTTLTSVSQDAEDSAQDVDRARTAAPELDALSAELNRLLAAFTV